MVKFEIHDWDADGNHDFIGSMETTLTSISRGLGQEIAISEPTKDGRSKKTGKIIFQSIDTTETTPIPKAFRAKFSAKSLPRMDKLGLGKSGN